MVITRTTKLKTALSYASTRGSLEQHAQSVEAVLNQLDGLKRVSFVTHSLGGRVVLRLLEREGDWMEHVQVNAVVQLGPPNRGSSIAEQTGQLPLVGVVLGPSFWEVAKPGDEVPPETCEFGVIAGVRGTHSGWNPWLAGDDDGVVGLAETRASFPHEHLSVNSLHTVLMTDERALAAISRFLERGSFETEPGS
jgi:pimeloyl-ACP methyl ester carboxylesterase